MTVKHPARKHGDGGRGRFEEFAETVSNFTSSAVFGVLCVGLVAAYAAVHLARLGAEWQILVGDAMAAVTLLLVSVLKNSERRAEHAIQRKLDAIADALLEGREGRPGEAHERLEKAIGLEERL